MRYIASFDDLYLTEVGNKFYQLSIISKVGSVPPAFCLKNIAFNQSLPPSARIEIEKRLILLKSNGGYGLSRIQKEIEKELDKINIPLEILTEIESLASELSVNWTKLLIVRSSSCFEDGEEYSGAGIYLSVPNVQNETDLKQAVINCWKASFSLQALAHRLRMHEFDIDPMPGLIIQVQVWAEYSGVVFSTDPLSKTHAIMVEYTQGDTSGIESGEGKSKSFYAFPKSNDPKTFVISANDLDSKLAQELILTSIKLKEIYKKEIEYEWTYENNKLQLLQCRPITTVKNTMTEVANSQPIFKSFDLYTDAKKLCREDLGEIKGICEYSITKRKSIRDFLVKNDCKTNGSTVLIFNKAGLDKLDISTIPSLNLVKTSLFTIDLGPHLRAFYSQRGHLKNTLEVLTSYSSKAIAVMVREFASGEYSAVSTQKNDKVLVEVCRGSLIGINRGFVETVSYLVNPQKKSVKKLNTNLVSNQYYDFDNKVQSFRLYEDAGKSSGFVVSDQTLIGIANFNLLVNTKFGKNLLEWTIISGQPIYIDNTPDHSKTSFSVKNDHFNFLSPGHITGKALVITDLKKLEYISSGPTLNISGNLPTLESNQEIKDLINQTSVNRNIVIVSKFPYTALSVLVDKVQGFIFENGPILCHLAIICRESRTPVALVEKALDLYKDGDLIDIHD